MPDTLHSQVPFVCGRSGQPFTAHFVRRPGDTQYRFVTNEIPAPDPGFLAGFFRRKAPPPVAVSGLRDLADYALGIFLCPHCGCGKRPDMPKQSAFLRCAKCQAINCIGSLSKPEELADGQTCTCAACGHTGSVGGKIDALPSTDTRTNTPATPSLSHDQRRRLPAPPKRLPPPPPGNYLGLLRPFGYRGK